MVKGVVKAMAVVVLATGCAGGGVNAIGGGDEVGTSTGGLSVDLRMRAVEVEKFSSLQMIADKVEVLVDGKAVPVQLTEEILELTKTDHAAKVASFTVPEDGQVVEIAVRMAPTGTFEGSFGKGLVNARSTTLRFKSTVGNLAEKNKAVVELNAARSFVKESEGWLAMVPKYRIRY